MNPPPIEDDDLGVLIDSYDPAIIAAVKDAQLEIDRGNLVWHSEDEDEATGGSSQ